MKANPKFKVKKTYEEVADFLKEQIISGVYQPGDRLPSLRELGEMLGVGQSTVREAISSLKTVGLVTIRQGEGTFVTQYEPEKLLSAFESIQPVTRQDIIALLEVRKVIECGIVRLAAERHTEEDLRQIEEALREMEDALNQGELGDKADWKFHYAIASASHNSIFQSIMQSISETMEETLKASRERLYSSKENPLRLYHEHRDIYEAIRSKNPKRAEEAMLYHLIGVEREMLK
ncbi:FadR/GntR family transcriptional regulator [Thermoflavimicrobium dichotomicum]|uniref:GntR family transcriptional regulator, transcriptional repressor for pyruvate dehydrogenase complex n=1 Tax=Thermoflavimicrobium dichotomicum TaxID=46223 RepID=A0A1I3RWB1_9BACL|nr:FadR/GntR family transcriptional regulator [Thermoflavimicrobium dichotomicum]SFJ49556.1 GntR family transcriptional regulator, transcriptional repressor for pyruvate dehydrogenase complex [Thermoflavimicrobium dichotomicum]